MPPEGQDGSGGEWMLHLTGTVQGVGFRPLVARLAGEHGLRGWVRNDAAGVTIRAAASASALAAFVADLRARAPAAARIAAVRTEPVTAPGTWDPLPEAGFVIRPSGMDAAAARTAVPPDLAVCADCRRELGTPGDRRHAYPFINCTQCGPRYTVITALPYDRSRTTMAGFELCPACRREYEDPADRRYHAQPNACPACGPRVALQDAAGRTLAECAAAIDEAARALRAGGIVAVKGIGGFHLMVEAENEAAVRELRRRKHREEKPLAVMFPSLAALRAVAEVTLEDERWLTAPSAPIVLVARRPGARLADAIAPGNPWIGALLPYAPLHVLLLAAVDRPLVATSGNLAEEPLCFDDGEARERLVGIADLFLVHDRPIARPVDDSVLRPFSGGRVLVRRARGFAPAPFPLPDDAADGEPLLCVGGHLKNTIAVTAGRNLVLSPHIGDLGNPASTAAFRRTIELLGSLYGGEFGRVACDAHPDYASSRFAETLGIPVVRMQHHLAHVLSCLLEHGGGPARVLGVAWDGTGYGSDGAIWGGEFIVVDRAARTARRVAHLRPFRLAGGEAAVREPRRVALALARESGLADEADMAGLAESLGFGTNEAGLLRQMLESGRHAPITTSAGRLFDGVAALLGLRQRSSFEAQAAMELEFAAARGSRDAEPAWPVPIIESGEGNAAELDWRPMIAEIVRQRSKVGPDRLAARCHSSLAAAIAAIAAQVGIETVVLTGGCFQNVRLLAEASERLRREGFRVLRHRDLPPNDGGLAAGQALGARWGVTEVFNRD